MKKNPGIIFFLFLLTPLLISLSLYALPEGFVYLSDVAPSIQQDMRYAGYHNFVGRPIKGYEKPVCILTKQAADALKNVQIALRPMHLSLKVYDCYRPQMAVADFYHWSQYDPDQSMKAEFYPEVDKKKLFQSGYIAKRSEHTMGSTVDLTIVPLGSKAKAQYVPGQKLKACYAPYGQRFADNSIDMGTGFDCLDFRSDFFYKRLPQLSQKNRALLRNLMLKNGFRPYAAEWWHFTYNAQPYAGTYFNFPVK